MILFAKKVFQKFQKIRYMFSEYEMIKKSIERLGYKWWESGDYDLNIIWVRMSDIVSNMMGDYCLICYKVKDVENVLTVKANTLPGLYGGLYNPITTIEGITGTAIVQPQQVLGAYQFIDKGINDSWNPFESSFFLPIKSIKIWRDNDKDAEIDYMQSEDASPSDGICWHFQEEPISSVDSKPWSVGCLGWVKNDLKNILYPIFQRATERWGINYSLTLIINDDLIVKIR